MRTLTTSALIGFGTLAVAACVQDRWTLPLPTGQNPIWASHVIAASASSVLVAGLIQTDPEGIAQFHRYFAEEPVKTNLLDSQEGLLGNSAGQPFIDRYAASGEHLWRWQLDTPEHNSLLGVIDLDEAADGSIYAVDFSLSPDYDFVARLHKLDAQGQLQWNIPLQETVAFDGSFFPTPEFPVLVHALQDGPVLVGYVTSRTNPPALQAYSPAGEFLWQFAGFGAPHLISHGERTVLELSGQRIVTFFTPSQNVADPEYDTQEEDLANARLTVLDHGGNVLQQASLTALGFTRIDDIAVVDDRLYVLGANDSASRLISLDDQFQTVTEQLFARADAGRLASHQQRLCYALIRNRLFHLQEPDWQDADAVLLGVINGREHWQLGHDGEPMLVPTLQADGQGCIYTDMTKPGLNDPHQSVRTVLYSEQDKVNVVDNRGVLYPYPVTHHTARQGRALYSIFNRLEPDADGQLRAQAYLGRKDLW